MLGKPSKCAKMPFCLAVIAYRTPDTMPDHLKLMKVRWTQTYICLENALMMLCSQTHFIYICQTSCDRSQKWKTSCECEDDGAESALLMSLPIMMLMLMLLSMLMMMTMMAAQWGHRTAAVRQSVHHGWKSDFNSLTFDVVLFWICYKFAKNFVVNSLQLLDMWLSYFKRTLLNIFVHWCTCVLTMD